MDDEQESQASEQCLPSGFLFARFDVVLYIVAAAIVTSASIASNGVFYITWILCPFAVILAIAAVAARRGVRKFVRDHGPVEISFIFSLPASGPKKNVLFRDIGELVDEAVDRVLDGKAQDRP